MTMSDANEDALWHEAEYNARVLKAARYNMTLDEFQASSIRDVDRSDPWEFTAPMETPIKKPAEIIEWEQRMIELDRKRGYDALVSRLKAKGRIK